jgi:hypothetical protein
MKLVPVFNKPALFWEERKTLLIADLHIGMEKEWTRNISRRLIEKMKNEVFELMKISGAERLIILGDLKHTVEGLRRDEERVIRSFLEDLSSHTEIILLKGNHDGDIEEAVPSNVRVYDSKGIRIGKLGLIHGHALPKEEVLNAKIIIMGHLHPVISFRERSGANILERVWVRGKGERECVIMPAFNEICGGLPVEEIRKEQSPVFKVLDEIGELEIYLMDGIKVVAGGFKDGI